MPMARVMGSNSSPANSAFIGRCNGTDGAHVLQQAGGVGQQVLEL